MSIFEHVQLWELLKPLIYVPIILSGVAQTGRWPS